MTIVYRTAGAHSVVERAFLGLLLLGLSLPSCKSQLPTPPESPEQERATKLSIMGVPSQVGAGVLFSLRVHALKADDTIDQNFSAMVTIAKSSGPGNLNGTLTKSAIAGIATFDSLSLTTLGTVTLIATSGTLSAATTSPISVSPPVAGPATQLGFSGVPSTVNVGSMLSLIVRALRADNSIDSNHAAAITLTLSNGPGTLGGTTTKAAFAGVATFDDLTISSPGTVVLRASSGSLTPATTGQISVNAGPPVVLKVGTFTGQNGYTTSGSVQVIRESNGTELVRTGSNFSVSGGAGTIGVWLTDAAGAVNLNNTPQKIRLGLISSGFSGVYTYTIPGGLGGFTHVVTFCEAARINFGFAQLLDP